MKAALLISPRHFEIADVPSPALKRGQILIAVKSVGICASDVPVLPALQLLMSKLSEC